MTTNTTFEQTCLSAAEEITKLLDVLGFTSDESHTDVKERIAEIISRNVQLDSVTSLEQSSLSVEERSPLLKDEVPF